MNICGEWDPCSVSERYSAENYQLGTIGRGRDGRRWVVVALNNSTAPKRNNTTINHQIIASPTPHYIDISAPTNILLSEKENDEKKEEKEGKLEKQEQKKEDRFNNRKTWALTNTELPLIRAKHCDKYYGERGNTKCTPLNYLDWWKWSTLPGIEYFCVRECGQGGDCLFATLVHGLEYLVAHNFQKNTINAAEARSLTSVSSIRSLVAQQISSHTVRNFLNEEISQRLISSTHAEAPHYRWDAQELITIAKKDCKEASWHVKKIISTVGNLYWGDTTTLELLCKTAVFQKMAIAFLIFKDTGVLDPRYISSIEAQNVKYIMMLYNSHNVHWQLVVYHMQYRSSSDGIRYYGNPNNTWDSKSNSKNNSTCFTFRCIRREKLYKDLPSPLRTLAEASWLKDALPTLGYSK